MVITRIPSSRERTQHIVLEGVTWATYQGLLRDLGDRRALRLAYDCGTLEMIMPSDIHEIINRLLALMVTALTDTLGLKIMALQRSIAKI